MWMSKGISRRYGNPSQTSITRKGFVTYQHSPLIYSDASRKEKNCCPTRNSTPHAVHSRHIPRAAGRDNFRVLWHHLAWLLAGGGLVTHSSAKSTNGHKKLRRTNRPTAEPCMDKHVLSTHLNANNVNVRLRKVYPLELKIFINSLHKKTV